MDTPFAPASLTQPRRAAGRQDKILVLTLVEEKQFVTKGSDSWVYYTVSSSDLEALGPFIEDIQVVAELKDTTANFRFKVIGEKSYLGAPGRRSAGTCWASSRRRAPSSTGRRTRRGGTSARRGSASGWAFATRPGSRPSRTASSR